MSSIVDVVRDKNCALLELLVAVKGAFSVRDAERGLLVAAENGYTDCVDVLLRAGVNPEVVDSSRGSALSSAASAGHDDVVRCLASAISSSGLNARWRGSTALHRAVSGGRSTCVGLLIAAGANVNTVDSAGDTPLIVAAKHCRYSLAAMKCLVGAGCDLERVDEERRTALHYACYRAVGAELLLSAGAKTNVQDIDGNAPIHLASIEGFDTIVRCLVTYNCDTDIVNDLGKMAIHYLAMKGHWQAIEDIACAGGDLDKPDASGHTPLWYAIRHKRVEAVRTLLLANCAPHPTNPDCSLPLEEALSQRQYILAQWLLLAGADIRPLQTFIEELGRQPAPEVEDEAVVRWLTAWLRDPHCLRQLCRTAIRKVMREHRTEMKHLATLDHLPPAMHKFVALHELEDGAEHWHE